MKLPRRTKRALVELLDDDLPGASSGWGLFQGTKEVVHPDDWHHFLACFKQLVRNATEVSKYVR